MTVTAEQRQLFRTFVAAMQAVVPEVTGEQTVLIEAVVERMLRERGLAIR